MEEIILGNRYELYEEIGTGGMAHVFKARDQLLERIVAIKVLKPEYVEDVQFVSRFRIEAQAAASLSNSNIVMIYDVGHDEGIYYIVMEYVDGITLKDYITNKGYLNWREAVNIAIQITQALDSAHSNNIIHRDIKPHNILITRDRKIKVTDFGIARAASNSTLTTVGNPLGSVHYFSPEQAKGAHTDEKSDIYSLGITLYEMVTGNVPFDGETPVAVALKHIQEYPEEPIDVNPQVPPGLNSIILKAIEKNKFDRYSTAYEMVTDLKKVLKDPMGETFLLGKSAADAIAHGGGNVREDGARADREIQRLHDAEDGESNMRQSGRDRQISKSSRNGNTGNSSGKRQRPAQSGRRSAPMKPVPIDERARNPLFIVLPLIAVVLAIGFMVWLISTLFGIINPDRGSSGGETYAVENYIGERYSDVSLDLLRHNIKSNAIRIYSDYEEGVIISQAVAEGMRLPIDGTAEIEFEVSDGKRKVVIPEYTGRDIREVQSDLRAKGLKPETEIIDEASDTVIRGYVTRTAPADGTEVEEGSSVTIFRSSGSNLAQAVIPYLIGLSYNDARKAITDRGFSVGETFPDRDIRSDDIVSRQSPDSGGLADTTISIDLWFERPADDIVETPTPTPEETATPSPTPVATETPTPTPEPTEEPTPTPEEPTTEPATHISKAVTLDLTPGKVYEESVKVLVEVTPSDTGIQRRFINRRIPLSQFPYLMDISIPVGGSTLVTVYFEGEFMWQATFTPD
ncbi:MAG: Stk1 family PASTA domain-containing Ser/Thr kinase [Oscillospiraceae bacterium]|nr:Stk1 family PASTA domain-containing Ser/Thr kinase [Oscillospiraceae bacterium]